MEDNRTRLRPNCQ